MAKKMVQVMIGATVDTQCNLPFTAIATHTQIVDIANRGV